jgi:hypothetical protein
MDSVTIWTVLSLVAAVGLILFWRGPNAIWGATTFGLIGGLIAASVYRFTGKGFHWSTVGKWLVVSALVGFATELFWRITRRNSN